MQHLPNAQRLGLALVSTAAFVGLIWRLRSAVRIAPRSSRDTIASPRDTLLPYISDQEAACLAYPPNLLPGGRDVPTPYGIMRVYEWGPVEGRKVVMVHGDATPCPMFLPIARKLVEHGCRVLTFDLWGRGYSDTPLDCQHDSRLYCMQILFAVTSSPISWTDTDGGDASMPGFSMIGFSMGGSITMDFLGTFSDHINSVVLLGPGGLLRDLPTDYKSLWYQYPSLISSSYMRRLIGTLLGVDLSAAPSKDLTPTTTFSPADALQFQFDHHNGHVRSFLSTLQYGPLQNQEAVWKKACDIIKGMPTLSSQQRVLSDKILVICGEDDSVVPPDHVKEDLTRLLGPEHFEFGIVPGGHGFPYPEGSQIGQRILDFWTSTNSSRRLEAFRGNK